jgi:hypothetical protein
MRFDALQSRFPIGNSMPETHSGSASGNDACQQLDVIRGSSRVNMVPLGGIEARGIEARGMTVRRRQD